MPPITWYELPTWWPRTFALLADQLSSGQIDLALLARWVWQTGWIAALIAISDFLLGAALLHRLLGAERWRLNPWLRAGAALALGQGLGALLLLALSPLRWIKPGHIRAAIALAVLAGAAHLWAQRGSARWFFGAWRARPRFSIAALLLLLLWLVPFAVHALDLLMPVIDGDSMMYHISAARGYAEKHTLVYQPTIRYNAHPQMTVLVYLRQWLFTRDDLQLKLANWEYFAMLLCSMLGLAAEFRWRRLTVLGLLLLAQAPVFAWMAKVEYADFGLATYLLIAAGLLGVALRRRWIGLIGPAALVLGFASSAKLQGSVMSAIVAIAFLIAAWRAGWTFPSWRRAALLMLGAALLCNVPWWWRSYAHTGSPVYPFFTGTADEKAMSTMSLGYGFGRSWEALALMPWRQITEPSHKWADPYIFGIPGALLLLAGLIALLRKRRVHLSTPILFWTLAISIYFAFWFLTGQVQRYLAAFLPIMGLLFVAALAAAGLRRARWWIVLPLALNGVFSFLTPSRVLLHAVAPPVTNSQRETVLAVALPFYRAVRQLNARLEPGDRTYLWFCEDARYYVQGPTDGDWFGAHTFNWLGRDSASLETMIDRLRAAGFRYLVVDRSYTRRFASIYPAPYLESGFVAEEGPTGGARLVINEGRVRVYSLDR